MNDDPFLERLDEKIEELTAERDQLTRIIEKAKELRAAYDEIDTSGMKEKKVNHWKDINPIKLPEAFSSRRMIW